MNIFEVVFSPVNINVTDINGIILPDTYLTSNSTVSVHSILPMVSTSIELNVRKDFNNSAWSVFFMSNGVIHFPRKHELVSFLSTSASKAISQQVDCIL